MIISLKILSKFMKNIDDIESEEMKKSLAPRSHFPTDSCLRYLKLRLGITTIVTVQKEKYHRDPGQMQVLSLYLVCLDDPLCLSP